ncbi:MAG: hypothetical protein E6R04_08860 [Spirochaetes bacterium]|nr:MAG: hypothetical protein E6R04_08860 [Spirochaetota bacterium]
MIHPKADPLNKPLRHLPYEKRQLRKFLLSHLIWLKTNGSKGHQLKLNNWIIGYKKLFEDPKNPTAGFAYPCSQDVLYRALENFEEMALSKTGEIVIRKADFRGCEFWLSMAPGNYRFIDCDFSGCKFVKSMEGCFYFERCKFDNARFVGAFPRRYSEKRWFVDCDLSQTSLFGAAFSFFPNDTTGQYKLDVPWDSKSIPPKPVDLAVGKLLKVAHKPSEKYSSESAAIISCLPEEQIPFGVVVEKNKKTFTLLFPETGKTQKFSNSRILTMLKEPSPLCQPNSKSKTF